MTEWKGAFHRDDVAARESHQTAQTDEGKLSHPLPGVVRYYWWFGELTDEMTDELQEVICIFQAEQDGLEVTGKLDTRTCARLRALHDCEEAAEEAVSPEPGAATAGERPALTLKPAPARTRVWALHPPPAALAAQ